MKSTLGRWERDFSFVLFVCMFFFIICLYTFLYIFVYFSYCSSLYFSTNLLLEKKLQKKKKKKKKEKKPNKIWKIKQKFLEDPALCFSSYRNRQLKVILRSVGTCERKRGHFLCRSFCPKNIFLTFVFYLNLQGIEYTFRIYILFHIKETLLHTLLCLFLKFSKASVYPSLHFLL